MICHKCAGRGTKRHHRDCEHRGEGHKGRGAQARALLWRAAEWSLVLRVRRGRHGAGLSLPEARRYLTKRLHGLPFAGTAADMRLLVARLLDCIPSDVEVERGEPGAVQVWVPRDTSAEDIQRAHRALEDSAPAYAAIRVDRGYKVKTRTPRSRDPWTGGVTTTD